MNFAQLVQALPSLDETLIVCAPDPWAENSELRLLELDDDFEIPESLLDDGFEFFLEVAVVAEVLGVFEGKVVSDDEKIALLVYYAENDEYPDWVES